MGTVPRRRQREEEDEEWEDADPETSLAPTPASGSKRVRLSTNAPDDEDGDDAPTNSNANAASQTDDDDVEENEEENEDSAGEDNDAAEQSQSQSQRPGPSQSQNQVPLRPLSNGLNLTRTPQDAYKPGAIVRIKVTNFVTYTSAEFHPGPKLNMVIGPNGTGKSTLVCAICLGLGWGPQHLGRAKETGEFVKHGCREATIEIELAGGPKFPRNPVITRTIKREGNKNTFTLNGKPASMKQVLKLAQSFAIQIDNLCQFLPQDKVSEFAALTPVELLNSTQRAAAGAEMVELHENLKNLRAAQKNLQNDNQAERDMLTNLEDRQESQRADVERVRQRSQIKEKIKLLEMVRPIVKFKALHRQVDQARRDRQRCQAELKALEEELEPFMRSVKDKQKYVVQVDAVLKHKQQVAERADRTATNLGRKIEDYEAQIKAAEGEVDAEKKSSVKYRQEGADIIRKIRSLKRQLESEPVEFDADSYNERIREKRREIRDLEQKAGEIKASRGELFERLETAKKRTKHAENQLRDLDSQAGQQEQKLKRLSQESLRAWEWLKQNQDKFEKEVFGPPVITCSVRDPRYADHIESLLQRNDFTTFTVQSRNDFRTLQRQLNGTMRLHDISIRTSTIPLANLRSPISNDQMRNLGFQGWARDFLDGPEPVVAMLCSENQLFRTPISLRDISEETYAALESGSMNVNSWVAGKQAYQITRRREYGPGASSTRVRNVRPAQAWTSQPVDASTKRELQRTIQELRGEESKVKETIEAQRAQMAELGEQHKAVNEEREQLEREKNEKQTAYTNFRAIPERIRQQEAKKKANDAYFAKIKANVVEIRNKQDRLSIEKAETVIQYADAVETLRTIKEEVINLTLWKVEGISDVEVLATRSSEHSQRLEAKKEEFTQKSEEVKAIGREFKEIQREASKVARYLQTLEGGDEKVKQIYDTHSPEELEGEIDSEKARLELTHAGSSNVLKEFEEREKQIDRLRTKLADFEKKLSDFNHAIAEIRGRWEPRLDAIVKSVSDAFSDSFARIGCAGQVTLDKAGEEPGPDGQPSGNDFEQWSIQVHVKFREHESLSLLDSHRQSGGERAVSTIFYLMALQSLSASPFRVVDEINQGMDPRNERMVHERLVDIACAESADGSGGGQYFLITPKLLSGLVYKPGMRVLCIVSGEHMPSDHNLVDFGAAVRNMRAHTARSNSKGKGKGRAIGAAPREGVAA
ncbi:P-loop containing nucleoside triphosphate hydrolase protein [Aspergillus filifer]